MQIFQKRQKSSNDTIFMKKDPCSSKETCISEKRPIFLEKYLYS